MPTAILTAKASFEQIAASQNHKAALKVEINSFDKGFIGFCRLAFVFDATAHTVRETPYSLQLLK